MCVRACDATDRGERLDLRGHTTMGFFSSRKTTELESDHYHVMTTMIEATSGTGVGGGNVGEKSVVKVIRSRFVSGFLCWSFFFFLVVAFFLSSFSCFGSFFI